MSTLEKEYRIVSGRYETGTAEQQAGFRTLLGEENILYRFDLYFHWYNIVHEFGHCLADAQGLSLSGVQEEMFVNRFAAAYWTQKGEQDRLSELETMLRQILAETESPVPEGEGFTEFFEGLWGTEELEDVLLYGYFQMVSVLEALRGRKDLRAVLKEAGILLREEPVLPRYEGAVCAGNAQKVLDAVLADMAGLGVAPIRAVLELADDPTVQCAEMPA